MISRWMESILRRVGSSVREGWQRDQAAKALARQVAADMLTNIRATVEATVTTAVWDNAAGQQERVWRGATANVREWIYLTRADELVCSACGPRHRMRAPTWQELPSVPAHPRCRCQVAPVTG